MENWVIVYTAGAKFIGRLVSHDTVEQAAQETTVKLADAMELRTMSMVQMTPSGPVAEHRVDVTQAGPEARGVELWVTPDVIMAVEGEAGEQFVEEVKRKASGGSTVRERPNIVIPRIRQ